MNRSELYLRCARALQRVLRAAALAFFAATLAGPVHALGAVASNVSAMAQAVAQENPMPSAFDCLPCASCYLAPAPTAHGFTGEADETRQAAWQLVTKPLASAQKPRDLSKTEASVPLRVANCCWRN